MKNKSNKIIAFILSMVMILSNVLPNITSDVFGLIPATEWFSGPTTIEPLIEYSDSGQALPERETTGTDLDNFEFSLKYGTIEDEIENDTLFVKDQSNKINATLRIEYRGEQSYNAGDLSMTFNYPTGIYRNSPNHDMLSDVGAELEGSGSGRGDWYYTKKNGELIFTNKQATTGSFTSSIEIVLEMPGIRNVISGFNSTLSASLNVNEFDTVLNSKNLFFSTKTTHDELKLNDIELIPYTYRTYSTDSSTYIYNGYKLDDYYIIGICLCSFLDQNNRGYNLTDTVTVPDDCFIFKDTVKNNSNVYVETGYSENSTVIGGRNNTLYIAVPKNNYTTDDQITVTWNKKAVFLDEGETWEESLEKKIPVTENNIVVNTINAKSGINKRPRTDDLIRLDFGENRGREVEWEIDLSDNTGYSEDPVSFAPKYTEIIDEHTYLTDKNRNKVREFIEDEYYLTYLEFYSPSKGKKTDDCNINIYAKKDFDLEYTYIDNIVFNNTKSIKVNLDSSKKYTDFKITIDGNWAGGKNKDRQSPSIRIGAFLNVLDFSHNEAMVKNEVSCNEVLNNDISLENIYYAYMTIKDIYAEVKASASRVSYKLNDSKISYEPSLSGYYHTTIPRKYYDSFKVHRLSFDISIPSYMNFGEITKEQISIQDTVYNENDNSLVSNKITSEYFNMNYTINQKDNNKILSINITIKDGYYISHLKKIGTYDFYYAQGYFFFKPLIYMDFDTYSNLLNIGKLPTSFPVSISNYKCEDFIYIPDTCWKNQSDNSYTTLTIPSLAGNTYQGVEKFANTGSGFTKDPSMTTAGGDYSYKLRIAGGETTLDNIILYDNLEEAYGDKEYWKGTFNGLDTTLLDMICEGEDYNYTVYYSKDKNQVFDLSDAGWIKEAKWTDALSNVKSIAIDLGGIRLNPKSLAYVIVNMKAPENANPGLKAYNSYAADYKAYDSSTGTLMETIKALPSNTTEVIYNKNITYTVNKVWDGKATDSVEVKLFANSEEKETITLNADNKWTHTFTDLPALDDSFSPIEYTVEETALNLYNTSYETVTDKDGNITTTVVNTRVPDIYTITKAWNINSEKIKLNIKTESGYDAEYDYINILDNDGNILESIDFEKLGLVISKNEYKTDKTYTAEVHMKDGKVYKTPVNMNKFTPTPIECDLYVDGKVADTFTLNEENGWKYTVIPSEKDNTNGISLYSDDVIISDADDIIIVDPGDNPVGDDGEPHEYKDLDGVCAECGKTKEDGYHYIIEEAGDVEPHDYIDFNGVCAECGETLENGYHNTEKPKEPDNTEDDKKEENNYHEYVDDNGICSVCGKSKDEHDKGTVIGKDDEEGIPVIPELPTDPHSIKEKTKGEWKTSITHTENGNNIDYTITNDVQHEIEISTITVSDPPEIVDTGNNNYLWIYLVIFGIGLTGMFFSKKKKAII